jgi:hypothetical protein
MLVEQLLSGWPAIQIRGGSETAPTGPTSVAEFPKNPDVDFRVGQLSLGYDDASSLFILLAHSVDSQTSEDPDLSCQATRSQLRTLSEMIPPLLAAGRPRCPMCDRPLGSGKHVCERRNGHLSGVES